MCYREELIVKKIVNTFWFLDTRNVYLFKEINIYDKGTTITNNMALYDVSIIRRALCLRWVQGHQTFKNLIQFRNSREWNCVHVCTQVRPFVKIKHESNGSRIYLCIVWSCVDTCYLYVCVNCKFIIIIDRFRITLVEFSVRVLYK